MKAKLVRHDLSTPNPRWSAKKAEQARTKGRVYTVPPTLPLKWGTEIDHPDAYLLVQQGVAIPADEACRLAAGMTEAEMTHAQARYEKLSTGMGYDEDGNEVDLEDVELDDDDDDDDTGDQGDVSDAG